MNKIFLALVFLIALFTSCETDFDVTADWQDITIVYCLLDQQEETQYIKINKAFLGDENALVMAQNPDSSNYGNNLVVTIEEYTTNNTLVGVMEFDTTTIYNKEPGTFYAPRQVIYKSKPYTYHAIVNHDTIWLDDELVYKLKIINISTGKEITSTSTLTGDFAISSPTSTIKFDTNNDSRIKWDQFDSIFRYEFLLQFQYYETYNNSSDTLLKSINLASDVKNPDPSQSDIIYLYPGQLFFNSCSKLIPYANEAEENNVKSRLISKVMITISGAAREFNSYIKIYEPNESIVQTVPEYTNIINGIGLFSSRIRNIKQVGLHNDTKKALKEMSLKF